MQASSRVSYLDGLRGIAAADVALSHFVTAFDFAIFTGHADYAHGTWEVALSAFPFLFLAAGSNFAVCIFLALSGFVLARSFHRGALPAVALVAKRAIRLGLPVLAASLLGWAVLAGGLATNQDAAVVTRSAWLASQFTQQPSFLDALLQAWNSLLGWPDINRSYNSVLWTMPIEFVGSLSLIAIFATGVPSRRPLVGGLLFLALGLAFNRAFVSIVLFGAALYLLDVPRFAARLRWRPLILVVLLALGTVPFSEARGPIWNALLLFIMRVPSLSLPVPGFIAQSSVSQWHGIAAVGLVALVTGWPSAQRILASPLASFLGWLSFPLYLAHIPALFSAGCFGFLLAHRAGLPYPAAVGVAFLAYVPVALGLALLMERLVDQPSIRLAGSVAARLKPFGLSRIRHTKPVEASELSA